MFQNSGRNSGGVHLGESASEGLALAVTASLPASERLQLSNRFPWILAIREPACCEMDYATRRIAKTSLIPVPFDAPKGSKGDLALDRSSRKLRSGCQWAPDYYRDRIAAGAARETESGVSSAIAAFTGL